MDWEARRKDFPLLGRTTYLNSCSLGPVGQHSLDAHAQFVDDWSTRGAASWYDHWMDHIDQWRKGVAKLLGCKPKEIAWGPSVAQLVGGLASAIARNSDRPDVVCYEQEFPSVVAGWGTRPGVHMKHVQGSPTVATQSYTDAIDEDTRAVVMSRIHYNSGGIQDVAPVAKHARQEGAFSLVEDYHGTGQLPADVKAWGADAVVGGSLKWLCGGMAACFMYVREPIIKDLEPQHSGWWANEGMFDFDNTTFNFWKDARRFEGGEVNMHGIAMAHASHEYFLKLGVENIRDRNVALVTDLLERLEDAGMDARVDDGAKGHSALVMVNRKSPKKDVKKLEKAGIIVDDRPGAVRVSPHFYNTEEENAAFVDALR